MNIDLLLHASHYFDRADALSASLLHHALLNRDGQQAPAAVEQYMPFERVLRQAQVQWEITTEVLGTDVPQDGLDYEFLIPENTKLDSSDHVSTLARHQLNYPSLFPDFPRAAVLGDVFRSIRRSATSSHQYVSLLVCREKLSSQLLGLEKCLSRVRGIAGFGVRYIIPVWGKRSEDPRWINGMAEWVTAWQRSIQVPPVSALLRFDDNSRDRAELIQSGLLKLGVPCCEVSQQNQEAGQSYIQYRAGRGSLRQVNDAALERISAWIRSGALLTPSTWARLEQSSGL
jgi:hypothetical protein